MVMLAKALVVRALVCRGDRDVRVAEDAAVVAAGLVQVLVHRRAVVIARLFVVDDEWAALMRGPLLLLAL